MTEITQFWNWFATHSSELAFLPSSEIIDDLDEQLARIDAAITAEVSNQRRDGKRILVVTAHGNQEKFAIVADVVAASPKLDLWEVQGLKPPRGFQFKIASYPKLKPHDWKFIPLKSVKRHGEIAVRIVVSPDELCLLDERILSEIIEEGIGEVLLSVCHHLEWNNEDMPGTMQIDMLAEAIYAWALKNGPLSIRRFLPEMDYRES